MKKSQKHNRYQTIGAFGGAGRRTSIKSNSGWVPGKNRGVNCDLTVKDKSMQAQGFRKKQNLKLRRPPKVAFGRRLRRKVELMDDVLEEIK